MKQLIIANWKSHKTTQEAIFWLEQLVAKTQNEQLPEKEIILCPSFTLLPAMKKFITDHNVSIKLGVQNISQFNEGAFTGEVNAKQVCEFATHAIVGHSERRRLFAETDTQVLKKIQQVLAVDMTPILCISDLMQLESYMQEGSFLLDNTEKIIFVYEPPSAISGGGAFHAEDPETVNKNVTEISKKIGKKVVTLYGGSINPDNVAGLFKLDHIDGGLVGQASLDPHVFTQIIKNS